MKTSFLSLLTVASAAVFSLPVVATEMPEESARLSSLPTLPYVTEEMYEPSYWIQEGTDGDAPLASAEEISSTNVAILESPDTGMYHLPSYDITFNMLPDDVTWLIAAKRCDLRVIPSAEQSSDPGYDALQESAMRVGEPAVADASSDDGQWFHVLVSSDTGWVRKSDVAICHSKDEWLQAQQIMDEKKLTVTASSFTLDDSQDDDREDGLLLTMGTRLSLSDESAGNGTYTVSLPARDEDGYYETTTGTFSRDAGVYEGTPDLTTANLLTEAFHMLGTPYGWGSMSGNEDCSGFVRGVYLVFGYDLPRNTDEQEQIPTYGVSFSGLSRADRMYLLDSLPTGAILFQKGHEMMYLGQRDGHYYVINDASSILRPGGTDKWYIRKVIINALDATYHSSGVLWLDSLTSARVPFIQEQ